MPTWLSRLIRRFLPAKSNHRICRKCKKQIKKHHRWHQVKVGWFAPWYTCEHWDCNNPLRDPKLVCGYEADNPKLLFEVPDAIDGRAN